MEELTLQVAPKYVKRYQSGFPLVQREMIVNWPKQIAEGQILRLVSPNKAFLGKAYYGKQNKGDGWVFSRNEDETLSTEFFRALLQEAVQNRQELFHDDTTTAFRLFNGEGDGLGGLTIDYYDGFLLLQWYSAGIYSYQKALLRAMFDQPFVKGIYEKKRFLREENTHDFVGGDVPEFPLLVKENGMTYATYLNDGWMTGIFLDQRNVRRRIMEEFASQKNVLNTFSYTGAFSVAALYGGALNTTSVDVAKRSVAKTSEQFVVNGFNPEEQSILVWDVFEYMKFAKRKNMLFDLVIADPPSFARTKKITFSVAKDYGTLMEELISITAPNGTIIASTNYANFSLKKFKEIISAAFKESKRTFKIRETHTLPSDFKVHPEFPEGNYLKVLILELDI
ncbi:MULTISPECIES: class I SAM-dependent rRNA methyltransferase [Listeria]|uniref:class I SAM-dependent rRNA methyltransferase n=1 Tax=Listeria TaxID=1637 RepID=UPI000B594FFA|nr:MULTISPECIES: class I SAM-dependent rRNA methyltransferase [Listeria]